MVNLISHDDGIKKFCLNFEFYAIKEKLFNQNLTLP